MIATWAPLMKKLGGGEAEETRNRSTSAWLAVVGFVGSSETPATAAVTCFTAGNKEESVRAVTPFMPSLVLRYVQKL